MEKYDIIHFEALGAENGHLDEETKKAIQAGELPENLHYLIIPDTVQEYLARNPGAELPDIVSIKTHSRFPEGYLTGGNRKSIITRSAGYDHVEEFAEIANVTSLRNYCVRAVAQTVIKFLYAACGLLNQYTVKAMSFERMKTDSFTELNGDRVVTIFGCGKIGKQAYDYCVGNGLTVQAVDIRENELKELYGDTVRFVSKEEAIKNSDIIVNVMNLTKIRSSVFYNVNYFSEDYLRQAKPGLVFINVTRGEIAPEKGLLKLYREGIIGGIGLDVFSSEAVLSNLVKNGTETDNEDVLAAKEMMDLAFSRTENIYIQAHQGFNSDVAASSKAHDAVVHMVEYWRSGKKCFDEQLPYYKAEVE